MYSTLKEVLKEANDLNMAVGAFNTLNLEMLPAIIKAAVKENTGYRSDKLRYSELYRTQESGKYLQVHG